MLVLKCFSSRPSSWGCIILEWLIRLYTVSCESKWRRIWWQVWEKFWSLSFNSSLLPDMILNSSTKVWKDEDLLRRVLFLGYYCTVAKSEVISVIEASKGASSNFCLREKAVNGMEWKSHDTLSDMRCSWVDDACNMYEYVPQGKLSMSDHHFLTRAKIFCLYSLILSQGLMSICISSYLIELIVRIIASTLSFGFCIALLRYLATAWRRAWFPDLFVLLAWVSIMATTGFLIPNLDEQLMRRLFLQVNIWVACLKVGNWSRKSKSPNL